MARPNSSVPLRIDIRRLMTGAYWGRNRDTGRLVVSFVADTNMGARMVVTMTPEVAQQLGIRGSSEGAEMEHWGICRWCGDHTERGEDPSPTLCVMCVKAEREDSGGHKIADGGTEVT